MNYLLDTDSLVFMIRALKKKASPSATAKARRLRHRIKEAMAEGHNVGLSAITKAELEFGAARTIDSPKEQAALEKV